MRSCLVLRCPNPVEALVTSGSGTAIPREFGVCHAHGDLIEAGADWRFDGDQEVILMGGDLDVGALHFTGYTIRTDFSAGSSEGSRYRLTLKASPRGTQKPEETLTFEIAGNELAQLAAEFAKYS